MDSNTSNKIRRITLFVCSRYDLSSDVIMGCSTKQRTITFPRQIIWTICRDILGYRLSFREIGTIGEKDHATVMAGIRTVRNQCEVNRLFREHYAELLRRSREIVSDANAATPLKEKLTDILRIESMGNMKIALREVINTL